MEPGALLRAGVLRLVHAVLEWSQLGCKNARSYRGRPWRPELSGKARVHHPVRGPREYLLRARAWRGRAPAERLEVFPRRFRAAYPRQALSLEALMATIYVDNKAYDVKPNQSLLSACLGLGLNLPYFCWHPALGSVGACRQCAVKLFMGPRDERGKLVMACLWPASEGTRLSIQDKDAVAFRAGVIEGLMLNHPHDCPVCDEGGECHLQDMTVMTGHMYRRYEFQK